MELLMLASVILLGMGYLLATHDARRARESAGSLLVQCDRYRHEAEWMTSKAAEYRTLWLEERALAKELTIQLRLATATAVYVRSGDKSTEEEGDPLTVAQADRLAVEAERRRQERAFARAMGEPVEPEAPDLAGMEPLQVSDEEFSPVPHLSESVGGEDDDDE